MPTITTGRFLKQADVSEAGEVHSILSVEQQNVAGDGKPKEVKWVMELSDLKPLILNTTNINRCIQAFKTSETDEWIGKSIVVYADPDIEFGGKIVGGVRLKAVKNVKPKPAPAMREPGDEDDDDLLG